MKLPLALAAAMTVACFAGPAFADAVVVIGDGPERLCYLSAKTGIDPIGGLEHCNLAIDNGLALHDRAATYVNRGVIEHKLGRVVSAMDDFNTCLRLIPDQPDAFLNRGVAKITLGQFNDALVDIQKGIDLGPSEPPLAYFDRAIAYEKLAGVAPNATERQAMLQKAYADYQRAVREAPGFTAASNALSRFRIVPKSGA